MLDRSERATSFGAAAREYDRYRVGPPPQALDSLLPANCASVLDLGAGTGLLTRQLVGRVDEVIAVDPDVRMRDVLNEACPQATSLAGTAECIPLPDSRVDAVMVSAAWHWMDPARALPEIARVLRPGGTFAVLWTRRDRRVPWVAELDAFVRELTGSGDEVERRIQHMSNHAWLPDDAPFTDVTSCVLTWDVPMTSEAVVGMFTTYSGFITQSDEAKRQLALRITARVSAAALPTQGSVRMPMACHAWRLRRAAD
ncbi:class I SAM-dependent methyltransferase [Streptomyces sp. NPDC054933]